MELERELSIASLRQQMDGMSIEQLRQHCETIYGMYLSAVQEAMRHQKPVELPMLPKKQVAQSVYLRAISPEAKGRPVCTFDELELQILDLCQFWTVSYDRPILKSELEQQLGGCLDYTIDSLRKKGVLLLGKSGAVRVSPLIRFELAIEGEAA